jgi:outer membrane protein OmpA-like peptidoglycan-associated protein
MKKSTFILPLLCFCSLGFINRSAFKNRAASGNIYKYSEFSDTADYDRDGIPDEYDKCPALKGVSVNHGCPLIPQDMITRVKNAAEKIIFAAGSAKLPVASFAPLDEIAGILNDNPDMKLVIEGYRDKSKEEKYRWLGQNRTDAIKAYLESRGVNEDNLLPTGYNTTKPVTDNKTNGGQVKMTLTYYFDDAGK